MAKVIVAEAGFYAGQYLSAGQSYDDGVDDVDAVEVSDKLTKDELLAIAAERGVQVDASNTKAEIIDALKKTAV